jgi:pimeloyl-ACP methyl ester carboxylesterase
MSIYPLLVKGFLYEHTKYKRRNDMGQYIEVEKNVKLYIEDIGEGTPVVFIHGWPVNHKMFEYQLNQLPQHGYRCIGIDLRGYGKSDAPFEGYSYDRMADDIHAIIKTLMLEEITLVGFSVGGAISVRFMARYSGYKISKLVLIGAAAPSFTKTDHNPFGIMKKEVNEILALAKVDRPMMAANFGKTFLAKQVSAPLNKWLNGLSIEASGIGTIKLLESLRDEDLNADLSKIHVSTAIFHGVLDKICPFEFAKLMHKSIQNSTLVPFEQSGHGILFDEQEKFNNELIGFLQK